MIFARESLVLGMAVMAPVLWYVFRRERLGKFWSISLHASAHRDTTLVFGAGLLTAAAFLAIYFQQWLIPHYDYGWLMRLILGASITCFVLLALVPHYEGKWQGKVHVVVSWAMVLFMPLTLLFHVLQSNSEGKIIALTGIALQMTLLGIFYGVKGMHEKFAALQTAFIAVYFLCMGILGYI